MKEHPWAAGSNRPRAFIPKVGDTDGTATPLRLCGCFQPSPYLAAQTDVLGCLYGANARALRMIDVIRRYRNFAPFVRRIGERKAQTCAMAIFSQLCCGEEIGNARQIRIP
jgi:hypothetical protein